MCDLPLPKPPANPIPAYDGPASAQAAPSAASKACSMPVCSVPRWRMAARLGTPARNASTARAGLDCHGAEILRQLASGSTLRRAFERWTRTGLLRKVHALLVAMLRGNPTLILDSCSVRAKRGGDLTGPNPTAARKARNTTSR